MLEKFLKSEESEKLTQAQLRTIQGGDAPAEPDPEEGRKGKVA
ncbi:hypothetical protein [Flavobacterium sp. LC2016-01]|nr:hypothetical protein [Flavobacterium sp. LC2016-01]